MITTSQTTVQAQYDMILTWLKHHRNVDAVMPYARDGAFIKTAEGTISLRTTRHKLVLSHDGMVTEGHLVKEYLQKTLR